MSKITKRVLVEDFYKTTLSAPLADSGDLEITVATPPANKEGFIIVNPESVSNRERMYYHDVIGNVIYVREVNRVGPQAHASGEKVQINDTSLLFNHLSSMNDTTFFVEKTGALTVKTWGGPISKNNATVAVADTNLTLTDSATNYIYYKNATNEVKVTTTEGSAASDFGIIVAEVTTASGGITDINYRNHKLGVGNFITGIAKTATNGLVDTYTVTYTDGTTTTFDVTNGNGIASIALKSSSQAVDTYEITYTDGTKSTYDVTNGASFLSGPVAPTTQGVNGDSYLDTVTGLTYQKAAGTWTADGGDLTGPQGIQGIQGVQGFSILSGPIAPTTEGVNGDTYLNTTTGLTYKKAAGSWALDGGDLTGPQGIQGIQGLQGDTGNGIASIVRTNGDGSPGTTDTYTITYTDTTTTTFDVYNGANGTGIVNSVVAGFGITVDSTNPTAPVVKLTILSKYDATTAPGVGNDNTEGYAAGSEWVDITNKKAYKCVDASTGAAVWVETTQSGGGGGGAIADGIIAGPQRTRELFNISITEAKTANRLRINLEVQPTGANFIVTYYKNGISEGVATITTAQSSTNGLFQATLSSFTSGSYVDGDVVSASITQVGSEIAGSNLSYRLE